MMKIRLNIKDFPGGIYTPAKMSDKTHMGRQIVESLASYAHPSFRRIVSSLDEMETDLIFVNDDGLSLDMWEIEKCPAYQDILLSLPS